MGALIDNPIAFAHFKVRGGWKNHLYGVAGYGAVIGAVITVTSRLSPFASVLPGWATALLGLQLGVLLLYGGAVVGNAIRRDISGGMLESHRLMPISSAAAVFGYLTGPPLQAVGLAAVNFCIGAFICLLSHIPIQKWLVANAIIAQFVVFLWVCVAFASFVSRNAFVALFGLVITAIVTGGALLALLPGLAVLCTPLIGGTIFGSFFSGRVFSDDFLYSLVAQLAIGAIFFRGAMRRYRRDDVPALGIVLGLALLAAWVGTSTLGIVRWDNFRPVITRNSIDSSIPAMIASIVSAMLIGLAPVAAAARKTADWQQTLAQTGRAPGRRPLPPPMTALVAACIILQMSLAALPDHPAIAADVQLILRPVAVVLLSFFLSVSYLLRLFYRAGRRAALPIGVWIIVWWSLPLGIDAIQQSLASAGTPRSTISLCSPLGELMDLWSDQPTDSRFGLWFHGLMAFGPAVAFYATELTRRGKRSSIPLKPDTQGAADAPGSPQ